MRITLISLAADSPALVIGGILGGLAVAAAPLIVELLRSAVVTARLPHPAARHSLRSGEPIGGPKEGAWRMRVGMPDDMSLVIDFQSPPDDEMQCWFWLIRAADASHYKVICDGHCSWLEVPLVLSGLQTVLELGTRSLTGAQGADAP